MAVTWEEETLTEASLVYRMSFRTSRTTQTHFLQAPFPTTKKGFIYSSGSVCLVFVKCLKWNLEQ